MYVLPGGSAQMKVESFTYGGKYTDISSKVTYTVIDNDGVISIAADGTVSGLKEGTASFIAAYTTTLPDKSTYTLYTQPVTVKVGEIQELTLTGDSSYELKDNVLTGVTEQTTLKALLENIVNAEAVKIYTADGEEITKDTALIGNGTLISMNGIDTMVIVKGDVNGDGRVNIADYTLAKRSVLGTYTLTDNQKLGADVNGDGRINIADYTFIKRHVLKTYNLYK
jgi:arginine deiminase